MAEDLANDLTLRDDGDEAQGPALTPRAVRQVQRKDPLQLWFVLYHGGFPPDNVAQIPPNPL
jgi:hypothetical protein